MLERIFCLFQCSKNIRWLSLESLFQNFLINCWALEYFEKYIVAINLVWPQPVEQWLNQHNLLLSLTMNDVSLEFEVNFTSSHLSPWSVSCVKYFGHQGYSQKIRTRRSRAKENFLAFLFQSYRNLQYPKRILIKIVIQFWNNIWGFIPNTSPPPSPRFR